MASVIQQILSILILLAMVIAIAHALQKPDSDRYGPLSSNEHCKIHYFENTEFGGERFCTKCEPGYENPYPEHQKRCTGIPTSTMEILRESTLPEKNHDENYSPEEKDTTAEDSRESTAAIQAHEKDNKTPEIKKDSEETGVDNKIFIAITPDLVAVIAVIAVIVFVAIVFYCIRKQLTGKNADTEKNGVGESGQTNEGNSQEMQLLNSRTEEIGAGDVMS